MEENGTLGRISAEFCVFKRSAKEAKDVIEDLMECKALRSVILDYGDPVYNVEKSKYSEDEFYVDVEIPHAEPVFDDEEKTKMLLRSRCRDTNDYECHGLSFRLED